MGKNEKPKATESEATSGSSTGKTVPFVERRRQSLPQPDFTFYKKEQAYPGTDYLFVGHSYNPELDRSAPDTAEKKRRIETINGLFQEGPQWLSAKAALEDSHFHEILSRFEKDLLTRLPESALVGPAIDDNGKRLAESFTIWRKEMRRKPAGKST